MLDSKMLARLSSKLVAEPDNYMHSFRRNLSLYVDQKEITLQEVAECADISLSTLKSFLYGDSKDCTLSVAVRLARVFGVSLDEMVGAGTLPKQTCESMQILRTLPESFTHFIRWEIHFHQNALHSIKVSDKAIEIMCPTIGESGNMNLSNDMEVYDISHLSEAIKPKIFMGIRIPNDIYAPKYFEGDIILLANDRPAMAGEKVVVSYGSNMWVLECKYDRGENGVRKNYYSIRDGGFRATEEQVQYIIGYIVKVEQRL